ncbi:hypothetical protein [Paracoccus versutus]|uniref:hypothetical protein n=1 Tax=Paracoccus versutus TaxID=34007 RepID=UPI0011C05526|nr:hypothetical protein [Paracoccus versutus]
MSLDRLIEDVEAGNTPSAVRFAAAWPDAGHGGLNAYRAANGSLDAAMALKDALLPGWKLNLHFVEFADGSFVCTLIGPIADDAPKWTFAPQFDAKGTTPARALLLAVLRAYRTAQREA